MLPTELQGRADGADGADDDPYTIGIPIGVGVHQETHKKPGSASACPRIHPRLRGKNYPVI